MGDDTYIYNSGSYTSGDGWDKILDVDGLGSIKWNGSALSMVSVNGDDEKKIVNSTCPRNDNEVSLAYRKAA